MAGFFQHSISCDTKRRHHPVCAVGVGRRYRMFRWPDLYRNDFFGGGRKPAYGNPGSGNISSVDVCGVLFVEEGETQAFAVLTSPLYYGKL